MIEADAYPFIGALPIQVNNCQPGTQAYGAGRRA